MPLALLTNCAFVILFLTPGLCRSVCSMISAKERMKAQSACTNFPGLSFQNFSANFSIIRSIFWASPGSRKEARSMRRASTMPRPVKGKSSMNCLRTSPLKSLRFARYSPICRMSKSGVCRRNAAMDSGVGGLVTNPKLWSAPMHFEGSLLKLRAAMASRRFCSFFLCRSVPAGDAGAGGRLPAPAPGTASASAPLKWAWPSQRRAMECRIESSPLNASRCRELKPPRTPFTPSEGNACVTRNFTSVSKRFVHLTSQS
mmetsp:Transcript_109808/g.310351  ORF Transcript_109808/g.310351 Transcript_109808/m.310351 type:complete len:258 (-) Transcript_109808:716-1489(-)